MRQLQCGGGDDVADCGPVVGFAAAFALQLPVGCRVVGTTAGERLLLSPLPDSLTERTHIISRIASFLCALPPSRKLTSSTSPVCLSMRLHKRGAQHYPNIDFCFSAGILAALFRLNF